MKCFPGRLCSLSLKQLCIVNIGILFRHISHLLPQTFLFLICPLIIRIAQSGVALRVFNKLFGHFSEIVESLH